MSPHSYFPSSSSFYMKTLKMYSTDIFISLQEIKWEWFVILCKNDKNRIQRKKSKTIFNFQFLMHWF